MKITMLFETCILPGCDNPIVLGGRPCDECIGDFSHPDFGPMLARTSAPPPTPAQIAERDQAMAAAQRRMREPERRANQLCWICDERHTCSRQPAGWECDECREIR